MRSMDFCLQIIHISNRSAGGLCVLQNHLKKIQVVNPKINGLYGENINNMAHLRKSSLKNPNWVRHFLFTMNPFLESHWPSWEK